MTMTAADVVRHLIGSSCKSTAANAIGVGLDAKAAIDDAIAQGLVEVVATKDTTYGKGVRFLAVTPAGMPTATRIGPSEYVVNHQVVYRHLRFTARGEAFQIVGEPITISHNGAEARVRQISGRDAGNEFSAYLHATR